MAQEQERAEAGGQERERLHRLLQWAFGYLDIDDCHQARLADAIDAELGECKTCSDHTAHEQEHP